MDQQGTPVVVEGPRDYVELLASFSANSNGRDLMGRLLELGQEHDEIDYVVSGNMAGMYELQPKSCFHNAQRLAVAREYHYVEGFALPFMEGQPGGVALIPVHHAWNLHQGREVVVDATWASGSIPDLMRVVYFGVRIPKSYITSAWDEGRVGQDLLWEYLQERKG